MADNRINIVISAQDLASGKLKDVAYGIDQTGKSSERSSGLVDGLRSSLGTAVVALGAVGAGAIAAASTIGFKFNSSVEQAEAKLMAFMRDGEKVAATLDWVKKEAAATQFSFTEMANAAADLTPVARTSGRSLEELVQQAEVLAALNPTEGLTGAVFSLREALSGDWVSIVDRFNLPRQRINELKAQGVPAMEIISRTLKEMGIDYDLVSKQGQTTAARFDQIKDKLTMLAGAAAKPIFDKVSEGLDALNQLDFQSLQDRLGLVGQAYVDMWDLLMSGQYKEGSFKGLEEIFGEDSGPVSWILGIREAAIEMWNLLKPALDELAKTVKADLMPALDELLRTMGPELKYVGMGVGAILMGIVYAIAAVTKAIAFLIHALIDLKKFMDDVMMNTAASIYFVWYHVDEFLRKLPGSLAGSLAALVTTVTRSAVDIQQFFQSFPEMVQFALGYISGLLWTFVTVDVPNFVLGVIGWFQQLPAKITEALFGVTTSVSDGMTQTSQAAQGQAASLVTSVVGWFQSLPGRIAAAIATLWSTAVAGFTVFKDMAVSWAAQTVTAIVNLFLSLPGRITSALQGALNGAQGQVSEFLNNFMRGFNAGTKRNAIGTAYSPGGMTLVGENGPELVNLPQGAQVTQAYQTRSQGFSAGQGGISLNFYGPVSTKNEDDLERLARRVASLIDQSGNSLARGMAA